MLKLRFYLGYGILIAHSPALLGKAVPCLAGQGLALRGNAGQGKGSAAGTKHPRRFYSAPLAQLDRARLS